MRGETTWGLVAVSELVGPRRRSGAGDEGGWCARGRAAGSALSLLIRPRQRSRSSGVLVDERAVS